VKLPEPNWRRVSPSLLLLVVALALFASPFTASWAGFHPPWYLPFALWAGLILLAALFLGNRRDDDR
jgi:hypothetical protein